MTEDDQFEAIMGAISRAQDMGQQVIAGTWGVRYVGEDPPVIEFVGTLCCPLGALCVDHPDPVGKGLQYLAGDLLDEDYFWALGFTETFDADRLAFHHGPAAQKGSRMALRVRLALGIDRPVGGEIEG